MLLRLSHVLPNAVARRVIIADIRDNLNATRLKELTEKDRLCMNCYFAALKVLEAQEAVPVGNAMKVRADRPTGSFRMARRTLPRLPT